MRRPKARDVPACAEWRGWAWDQSASRTIDSLRGADLPSHGRHMLSPSGTSVDRSSGLAEKLSRFVIAEGAMHATCRLPGS